MNSINRDNIEIKNDCKISISIKSDNIIKIFKSIGDTFEEKYGADFGSISGYHISVLDTYECKDIDVDNFLSELESILNPLILSDFSIKTAISQDFPPYKRFFMLKCQSNEINNLRLKYELDSITIHISVFRETKL